MKKVFELFSFKKREAKMNRKKGLTLIVSLFVLCLALLTPGIAHGETVFNSSFMKTSGLESEGVKVVYMLDYIDDTCYAYLDDYTIRTYTNKQGLLMYCQLPKISAAAYSLEGQLEGIVTHIAAGNHQLFGYNIHTGEIGTIDHDGVKWGSVNMDFEMLHPYDDEVTYRIARSFINEERLFLFTSLSEFQNTEEYALFAFDLNSGKATRYDMSDAVGICQKGNDSFLLLCKSEQGWKIEELDTQSGEVKPLSFDDLVIFPADEVLCGMAYDQLSGDVFFTATGKIWRGAEGEELKIAGNINADGALSEDAAWILPEEKYALSTLSGLNIVDVSKSVTGKQVEDSKESQLTVQAVFSEKLNSLYQAAYPETAFNYLPSFTTADDLAQKLLTRDGTIDVYMIKADHTFTQLKKKEMLANLSSSDIIKSEIAGLDPLITSIITNESGEIVSYPSKFNINVFSVHQGYWQLVFGDRPLPATIEEVLDAWILWEQEYEADYPDLDMWYGFDHQTLCHGIIEYYVKSHDQEDAMIDMEDASLRSVLDKLHQIYTLREKNGRTLSEWTLDEEDQYGTMISLFAEAEIMNTAQGANILTDENTLYGQSKFAFTALPLSWGENAPSEVNGNLWVYVINPYTEHMEEALRYLEYAAKVESNPYLYYAIHPVMTAPYEDPNFEAKIEKIIQNKEDVDRALESNELDTIARTELQSWSDYYAQQIENQDQIRYLISSDTIHQQRALMEKINLNADSIYLPAVQNNTELSRLVAMYTEDAVSLEGMLQEYNRKLMLIRGESM